MEIILSVRMDIHGAVIKRSITANLSHLPILQAMKFTYNTILDKES